MLKYFSLDKIEAEMKKIKKLWAIVCLFLLWLQPFYPILLINEVMAAPSAPSATPISGTYSQLQNVSLIPAGEAMGTYYSVGGSDPDTNSIYYNIGDTIPIDGANGETVILKAISYNIDVGDSVSSVMTENYIFDKQGPEAPTANLPSNVYNHSLSVGISVAGDALHTYYTLDGNDPDVTSTEYTVGTTIPIDGNDGDGVNLKIVSFDNLGNASTISTYSYIFDKQGPATPIANVASGSYQHAISIGLTIDNINAVSTFYTVDNSTPNNPNGIGYTAGEIISIDGNDGETITLKAISYDVMNNASSVANYIYLFDKLGPNAPTVNINGGSYNHRLDLILTPAGDATSTYFTLNGDSPSVGSTLYSVGSTIPIDGNTGETKVLKSVSYDNLGNIGTTLMANYVFDKQTPIVIGISDNTLPANTVTWDWDADEQNSVFRFVIDQDSTAVPTGIYGTTKTATINTGDGTYYIHVQAKDPAENESEVKTGLAVLDTTPPTIPANLNVSPTSPTNQIQQRWNWEMSTDNMVGVKGYRYWIINSDDGSTIVNETAIGETAVVTNLNTGNYIFYVNAEDNLGNISDSISQQYVVDARIPQVTVTSPREYLTITNDLNLLINTDVNTTCAYIIDNQTEVSMTNTGVISHSHQITGLVAGDHNIQFNCTNYLGTVGSTSVGFNSGNQTGNVLDVSMTGANIGSTLVGVGELPNGISTLLLSNSSEVTFRNLSTGNNGTIDIGGNNYQLNSFTSGSLNNQDLTSGVNVQNQNILVNKAVKFESGIDGSPITLTNKDLTDVSAIIPDGTVILGPDPWDGVLMGPKANSNSTEYLPAGFMIGDVAIEIGSNNNTLIFDRPVKIEFKNKIGDFSYKAAGETGWVKMNTCQGTYANPVMPPFAGECSIDNGTDTTIYTYHFTAFAQIKGIPGYVNPDWNLSQKNETPSCNDLKPSNKPSLFRIDATNTSAKLFFAPAGNPNSYYFVAYGEYEGDERFGIRIDQGQSSGVLSYSINRLKANSTYYFKIRGGNGCTPGDWSNNMWIKTNKKTGSFFAVGQKALISKTLSKITSYKNRSKSAPIITPRIITELPSVDSVSFQPEPIVSKKSEGVIKKMGNFFKSIFGK